MSGALKWEKCNTCSLLLRMLSHPLTDGNPLSNELGYACGAFLDEGVVVPNWNKDSIQCEMWTPKSAPQNTKEQNGHIAQQPQG